MNKLGRAIFQNEDEPLQAAIAVKVTGTMPEIGDSVPVFNPRGQQIGKVLVAGTNETEKRYVAVRDA